MKRYILFTVIAFLGNISYSQNTSKIQEINNYYKAGLDFFVEKDYEKALEAINLGLKESEKKEDKSLIAYGNLHTGTYYFKTKKHSKSLEMANASLSSFKDLKEEVGMAECYHLIGRVYYGLSQYEKSLENYFKALNIYEHRKDEVKIALNLSKIAGVYLLTADFIKAREILERVIIIYKKTNDEQGVLSNITALGASYQKEGNLNKAIEIYKVSLFKSRELGAERIESILLGNIGSSYRRLGNYKESLNYLFKALPIKIKQKRFTSAAHTYNDISETYIEIKNLIKAKEYALKAIQFSKGYSLHQERYAYFILSNIEYDLGNYKSSTNNLKAFQKLEDSIFSIEKTKNINELQIKYETEKQDLKIEAHESNIALLASKNRNKNQSGQNHTFFVFKLFI
ncbi:MULTISPECIES: tetratricopeptide repeat protein [unclassified Polaribacter]|uniref:tetratricopeptide repeat protein n=1 Tax=unclassified Polaribacter TaxID=196858 RepID=UPI0016743697|nr:MULTISPECIES: tetratricopeptide repeat protein [unclassified Polaribacter]